LHEHNKIKNLHVKGQTFLTSFRQMLRLIVEQGAALSRDEAKSLLTSILAPSSQAEPPTDLEIAALLTAMATRGETADELTGVAEAMRALAVPLPLTPKERAGLVDTCGTGGDGLGTFNISTGAALVAVAAGAKVAKHGNRAVTSQCGSADVLEALGVPVTLDPDAAVACLRATGFMFLYAPALHPALKRVHPVRRALGFRTIFNLAGPLTNPAGAPAQVMGVFSGAKLMVAAEAMVKLGIGFGLVAHGRNGMDEIALSVTDAVMVTGGAHPSLAQVKYSPEMFGMKRAALRELTGAATAAENAAILERIFAGERSAKRNIVVVNAAAALYVGRVAQTLEEGVHLAADAIDSGAVRQKLTQLREFRKS
jgi:anthranilate phosphoribosyltransferase